MTRVLCRLAAEDPITPRHMRMTPRHMRVEAPSQRPPSFETRNAPRELRANSQVPFFKVLCMYMYMYTSSAHILSVCMHPVRYCSARTWRELEPTALDQQKQGQNRQDAAHGPGPVAQQPCCCPQHISASNLRPPPGRSSDRRRRGSRSHKKRR